MAKQTAIIVVNWNSFSLTNDCICSLKKMTAVDYDIIVIDNNSKDESGLKLKDCHPDILLLQAGSNLGFTGGNNLGMKYALSQGYEYLFLLNNDTFVQENLLSVLVGAMRSHPDAGAVQPIIYMNSDRSRLWNGGSFYNRWLGHPYSPGYNRVPGKQQLTTRQVDWITGCAFFLRGDVIRRTGGFAENLFIYNEDVDLSFRIREKGFQLWYTPEAAVYHIAGMSSQTESGNKEGFVAPRVHYMSIRNRIWFLKKHTKAQFFPTVLLFNFFYILAMMAYFASRLYFIKLRHVMKGVKDGLSGGIKYAND